MSGAVSFRVQLDDGAPARMTDAVATFCAAHGLPPGLLSPFAVAFDEILTNIASYGYRDGGEKIAEVRLSLEEGALCAEVVDGGVPFDPLEAPSPDTTLGVEERAIGGLGILLVRRLMDRVSYERREGRNILRFAKAVPR